jgi:hypothetical protein
MIKGRREIERLSPHASRPIQLHVGKDGRGGKRGKIWHTDSNGLYWMGDVYHRTPKQLLQECLSTIRDLLINHPDLEF